MNFKDWWGTVNEKALTIVLVLVAIAAVHFLLPDNTLALMEIVLLKLVYVACLLAAMVCTAHFLRGTKYDIYQEILDEGNVAAALLLTGIFISIAIVIGK